MKQDPTYLTQEKFDELTKELDELKTVKRSEIAKELEYSKGLGDLSENAEYHQAREAQMNLEERIAKLELTLKNVKIVKEGESFGGDGIGFGSQVTLSRKDTGAKTDYTIVGSEEADITSGKLSITAPLAKELIGKTKGDVVKVKTPKGEIVYKIERIA